MRIRGAFFLRKVGPLIVNPMSWGDPDGPDSYEFGYGRHMGANRAISRGRVVSAEPDSAVVLYADGAEKLTKTSRTTERRERPPEP